MDYAKIVRNRRLQLRLEDTDIAAKAGLSIHQYGDVEQHADEFETAISMLTAKRISKALGLSIRDVLRLPPSMKNAPRVADLVRNTREARHMSQAELADRIGFKEVAIRSLESSDDYADTLPLRVVMDIETQLGLERGVLVRD